MDVQLEPEQPDQVVAAVVDLLGPREPAPDPWWVAGLAEALEPEGSG